MKGRDGKKLRGWDGEYQTAKRGVRKELRAWRRGDGRRYKELKIEYKEICIRKKQEANLRFAEGKGDRRGKAGGTDMGDSEQGKEKKESEQGNQNGGMGGTF